MNTVEKLLAVVTIIVAILAVHAFVMNFLAAIGIYCEYCNKLTKRARNICKCLSCGREYLFGGH